MKEQEVEITNSIFFEFQRYVRGEMTKREESTFQKNIRKDVYAETAIEGFTEIPEEEVSFFTNLAEEEEEQRIKNRKRLIYSIVASLIVLLVATSAYLVVEKKITVRQFKLPKILNFGGPAAPAVLPVVTDPQQISAFGEAESMAMMTIPDIRNVPAIIPDIIPEPATTALVADSSFTENKELLATASPTDSSAISDQVQMPSAESAIRSNADTSAIVRSETGSTDSGSTEETGEGQISYTAARPLNGDSEWVRYIQENMRKPQSLPQGENAVAVVSFTVKETGNVDGIKVLSSPGEEYTAEAIRLIKEGPAWRPAENNGRAIADEKMLRIVFK